MVTINKQTGNVVAADTQASAAAIDNALLQQARLCASVIEASGASHLPLAMTQHLLASLTSGLTKFVDGRAEMTLAVRELVAIQARSNLAETSFGCPGGPITASASTISSLQTTER